MGGWVGGGVVAWCRGGVVAWWRGGAWWRGAWWRGGVVAWWRGGVVGWWDGGGGWLVVVSVIGGSVFSVPYKTFESKLPRDS